MHHATRVLAGRGALHAERFTGCPAPETRARRSLEAQSRLTRAQHFEPDAESAARRGATESQFSTQTSISIRLMRKRQVGSMMQVGGN